MPAPPAILDLVARFDSHRDETATKTDFEHTALLRQISSTDDQIDHFVYDLYGLTEDEIKIVEGR